MTENNDQVFDLEEHATKNKKLPKEAKRFRIRVDKDHYVVDQPSMTGEEILRLAGKDPPNCFRLVQRVRGGAQPIALTDVVDFTTPGIERFNTLPLDQKEGESPKSGERRDFDLGEEDREYLQSLGLGWETIREGNTQWVIIHGFAVPEGYAVEIVSLGVQLPPGYPDVQIDMVFFFPALVRKDGKVINATNATVNVAGKQYQRWSRHRTPENPWRPGVDSLTTHVELVRHWLQREFQ